ncbi:MAG TPA: hypothetical protein DCE55_29370 [Planctomycetaceae bacterium]|nr:hypothetical protein [Planctomycetaceae bacterium]|tara:strand:- start:5316 stop:5672 length:357 start_codon:yes stop_codon:yes gene_type:complete
MESLLLLAEGGSLNGATENTLVVVVIGLVLDKVFTFLKWVMKKDTKSDADDDDLAARLTRLDEQVKTLKVMIATVNKALEKHKEDGATRAEKIAATLARLEQKSESIKELFEIYRKKD